MQILKNLNLFNHTCLLCHASCLRHDICTECAADLPWFPEKTIPLVGTAATIYSCFEYKNPVRHLITQLKFHENLVAANLLGNLMSDTIANKYSQSTLPQLIIPVPLHKKRLQQRGFNQAVECVKPISKQLKIPISLYDCIRKKNTKAQTEISAKDREKNLSNAFSIVNIINAKHIAIFDDVLTTGSTVRSLQKQLEKHGVQKIDIWCIARVSH